MTLALDCAGPPPHLLQGKSDSWPCPYNPHEYPAPESSPSPMSPQSLQSYMSNMSDSPLSSQELNHLPSSSWYGPSVSAPDSHQVRTFPVSLRTLTHGCPEWLRRIWPISASAYVFCCSLTTHIFIRLLVKTTSPHSAHRHHASHHVTNLFPHPGTRVNTAVCGTTGTFHSWYRTFIRPLEAKFPSTG
jgi:hypothetical protein